MRCRKVVCGALSQSGTDKIDQVTDCHRQLDISACTVANKIVEEREMARDHHMLRDGAGLADLCSAPWESGGAEEVAKNEIQAKYLAV